MESKEGSRMKSLTIKEKIVTSMKQNKMKINTK